MKKEILFQSFGDDKILITRNAEFTFTPQHKIVDLTQKAYIWIHENEIVKNRTSSYPIGYILSAEQIRTIINP